MTLRQFLFLNVDNNYGYNEVAPSTDSLALGGLSMSGAITMATNKITGLGNGVDAQDAVTKAQMDAAITGLTWKPPVQVLKMKSDVARAAAAALVAGSGGTGIVSLTTGNSFTVAIDGETPVVITLASAPADRAAAITAINTLYGAGGGLGGTIAVAGAADQIDIKSNTTGTGSTVAITSAHANWLEVGIVNATDAGTNNVPTAAVSGEAWVVNNWGTGYVDGDIVEWSGSAWVVVLPGATQEPPDNTRVTVISSGAAGSFVGQENKYGTYDADPVDPTWSFVAMVDGDAELVSGEGSVFENMAFTFDTGTGWVQFTGPASLPDATSAPAGGTKGKVGFDSSFGLQVNSGQAKINVTADTGLIFNVGTGAMEVEVNAAQAIHVDGDGIGLSIKALSGLEFDTNELAVLLEAAGAGTGGLQFNAGGEIGILLQDTSPGLQLTADGLDTKLKAASGLAADADGLYVVGDADAGIVVSGTGVGIALEAGGVGTGGLEFNLDGELRADPDTAAGITLTANGIGVALATAGVGVGGLQFNGSGEMELDLDAADGALALSADGLAVVIDNTTIGINGSNQLYVKGAGDATRVSAQLIAGAGGIAKGNAVYISGNNTVLKADKDAALTAAAIGVAPLAITAGDPGSIVFSGIVTGILAGATAGAPYFVTDAGVLSPTVPSGAAYVRRVGYAVNATDLLVMVGEVTKK